MDKVKDRSNNFDKVRDILDNINIELLKDQVKEVATLIALGSEGVSEYVITHCIRKLKGDVNKIDELLEFMKLLITELESYVFLGRVYSKMAK